MNSAKFEKHRLQKLQKVQKAALWYEENAPALFRSTEEKAKLLAAGILFSLDTEEAALLEDSILQKRKKKGGKK